MASVAYTADELAQRFGLHLHGNGAVRVDGVGTLARAGASQLAFLANPKYRARLATTRAGAVIVAAAAAGSTALPKLVSPNPYATYARVVDAGFEGKTDPWNAFWGQRFAYLRDPDGNTVALFAPLG